MVARIYRAPWSRLLAVSSIVATVVCVGVGFGIPILAGFSALHWAIPLFFALPPACALFAVRGYRISETEILVLRPGWVTRLPRAGLASASVEPHAMKSSLRLWGNGGFFSFTGLFWNKRLGRFRAFVTDGRRSVVLRYAGRTVVLSPGEPEEFVRELQSPR